MTSRLLIATIGGSPEPLAASLLHWRPVRSIFVVSPETKEAVNKQISPAVQKGGWPDFDAGRYDLTEISDAQDFSSIVTTLRNLDERIARWLRDHPDSEVIADFTGGTKAMTAGLALTAARWPCQISYVGGTERTKDGLGTVLPGREQIVHAQNPWDALGYLAVEQAKVLFNHSDFSAASRLLETTRNKTSDETRKREIQAFCILCQALDAWERFQHKEALAKIQHLERTWNDLIAAIGQTAAHALNGWIKQAKQQLESLTSGREINSSALVTDLFANAARRVAEGRYDDAVARLYRAIEALAQARLGDRGYIDTSYVPVEKIPEPLKSEWQTRAVDGHLKLGLQDDYRLLAVLGDEIATRFKELELDDPRRSLLVSRNGSILAHGYAPVSEQTAEKLLKAAGRLPGLESAALAGFPTLP